MAAVQTIELTFVTSNEAEAKALEALLQKLAAQGGDVEVDDVFLDSTNALVTREQVVTAVLTFSLNVAAGALGNVVYNAFQACPSAQCVANETPLTAKDAQDKAAIEAKLRAAAIPKAK